MAGRMVQTVAPGNCPSQPGSPPAETPIAAPSLINLAFATPDMLQTRGPPPMTTITLTRDLRTDGQLNPGVQKPILVTVSGLPGMVAGSKPQTLQGGATAMEGCVQLAPLSLAPDADGSGSTLGSTPAVSSATQAVLVGKPGGGTGSDSRRHTGCDIWHPFGRGAHIYTQRAASLAHSVVSCDTHSSSAAIVRHCGAAPSSFRGDGHGFGGCSYPDGHECSKQCASFLIRLCAGIDFGSNPWLDSRLDSCASSHNGIHANLSADFRYKPP
ncbi:hypothetical protein MTO96_004455 [Rhipicephalus appendiculatus]